MKYHNTDYYRALLYIQDIHTQEERTGTVYNTFNYFKDGMIPQGSYTTTNAMLEINSPALYSYFMPTI